jgi:hypothetical protein
MGLFVQFLNGFELGGTDTISIRAILIIRYNVIPGVAVGDTFFCLHLS